MKHPLLKTALLAAVLITVTPTTQAGWIKRYIYNGITGTAVTNLLYGTNMSGVVPFPDSPDVTELIPPNVYDWYFLARSASAIGDNFGDWTPGYLEPPETGNYTFWVCGDDETQLWLTTDAADPLNPTNKQMIASVPGYSNAGEWAKYPQQQSAVVYLEKGKQYYLEVLHKDGTGGDNIGWGWQLPSGALERPLRTFYLQPKADLADTNIVDGPFAAAITPKTLGDPTIYDGMEVMLFANLNLAPPYTVAWLRGATEIAGANQTYYRFRARTSDNGAQFFIRINGTLYGPLTLSVSADNIKPELVSAVVPSDNPTQIQLVFSELLTPQTATNSGNYSLNTATVQSAQLQADGLTVVLKTTLLNPSQFNTLTISGLQDWALPVNTIATVQTNLLANDRALSFRAWYSALATSLATLRTWSTNGTTAATYTNNLFDEERIITTTTYPWPLYPLRNSYVGQMIGYVTPPETGNYRFAIASDDDSILYLGTSELRSSKREICNRSGSTTQWNVGNNASQKSAYIALEAGKRYYIEAVYRDGTGGEGVTVVWETPSDTAIGHVLASQSAQADTQPFLISTNYLTSYVTFGNVFFKTNLAAAFSAAESARPTLSVAADGSRAYAYQWYQNGAPIPGAISASYTLPYVRPADNNATFYAVAANSFSSATSVVATLTVTNDTVKPALASVGSLYKQVVEVRLSEPVTPATATALANYLLFSSAGAPVAVTAAIQDTNDAAHITLQTAPLPETDLMKLVVQNLVDLSAAANVMAPQTNTFRANNFEALARINNSQAYSASAVGDQIFMTAGGSDIWGTSDQCAYLYKTVTGNFDYKVQSPASPPAVNGWTKAGPMARASTAINARNAIACFTAVTPGQNQYSPQVRDATGGASTSSAGGANTDPLTNNLQIGVSPRPTVSYPSWLRLQRIGNAIYYYYSPNGTNWTFWTWYDSAGNLTEGPLPATIEIGLAATSHDTARTADLVLSSFTAVDDGALRFTLSPTNVTVAENATAKFYAAVAGHSPWYYLWFKNSTLVASGTNGLTLTMVPFSDNNATISCTVTNPYGESITATAHLYVQQPDTIKPTVAKAGSLFKSTVEVYFSEGVTAASAINTANYSLRASNGTPVAVSYVVQDSLDLTHVTLTTDPLPECDLMRLACHGLVDLSLQANVMDLQTNIFRANNFDGLERINNTQNFSARAEGDQIFMTAGGSDIWGTADQCAFLYKAVSGNFDYKIQGVSLPPVNQWCKMGPMVRASSSFMGDRNNFACFTPSASPGQNTYSAQVRTNTSIATASTGAGEDLLVNLQAGVTARPTVVYPSWLRLQRIADTIYYYYSIDGTNWTFWTWYNWNASSEGPLPADVYLGLALTSHDTAQTVDGVMASFSLVNEGPLHFTREPASAAIVEGGNVTFTAAVAGRGPSFYQWKKNDIDIPNATGTALALTGVPIADNGSWYACRATNLYGDSITSSNAVLTVLQDVGKPVAYAVGSLKGTGIGVYFSDNNGLDPATATDPANYTVNAGAVTATGATLDLDRLAVMLTLSAPISGDFSVTVSNVKDGAPIANVIDPVTLHSTVVTWPLDQDIGTLNGLPPPPFTDPVMPGFAQAIGTNGFYVHAGGSDIWNLADGLHFVYQSLAGDFDVAARVGGLRMADVWSKAGLMVRADLDGTSRNYLIAATPTTGQNLITMQWRPDKNVTSLSLADAQRPRPSPIPNAWLRMTRSAQVFSFFYGTNGTDWVNLYTTNEVATPYPASVYVGLATTSHNNGSDPTNTTSAYFLNVTGLTLPVARPVLTAAVRGANLVLTWTTTDSAFKLQSTALVTTGWADDPATRVVAGNLYTVTVPLGTGPKFYRLIK